MKTAALIVALLAPTVGQAASLDLAALGLREGTTILGTTGSATGDADFFSLISEDFSLAIDLLDLDDVFNVGNSVLSYDSIAGDTLSGSLTAFASDIDGTELLFTIDSAEGIFASLRGSVLARVGTDFEIGSFGDQTDLPVTLIETTPIPIPATSLLLLSAIAGALVIRRKS